MTKKIVIPLIIWQFVLIAIVGCSSRPAKPASTTAMDVRLFRIVLEQEATIERLEAENDSLQVIIGGRSK